MNTLPEPYKHYIALSILIIIGILIAVIFYRRTPAPTLFLFDQGSLAAAQAQLPIALDTDIKITEIWTDADGVHYKIMADDSAVEYYKEDLSMENAPLFCQRQDIWWDDRVAIVEYYATSTGALLDRSPLRCGNL